jgi:hypothetical protein
MLLLQVLYHKSCYMQINNLVDVHAEHILTPSDNRTRGNAAYRTLYSNADVYRYSFFPRTIITWNTIQPTLRQVNTKLSFVLPLVGVCCSGYKDPTLSLHIQ